MTKEQDDIQEAQDIFQKTDMEHMLLYGQVEEKWPGGRKKPMELPLDFD